MTWWTGLAPWEFEFPLPGILTSTLQSELLLVAAGGDGADAPVRAAARAAHPPVVAPPRSHPSESRPFIVRVRIRNLLFYCHAHIW